MPEPERPPVTVSRPGAGPPPAADVIAAGPDRPRRRVPRRPVVVVVALAVLAAAALLLGVQHRQRQQEQRRADRVALQVRDVSVTFRPRSSADPFDVQDDRLFVAAVLVPTGGRPLTVWTARVVDADGETVGVANLTAPVTRLSDRRGAVEVPVRIDCAQLDGRPLPRWLLQLEVRPPSGRSRLVSAGVDPGILRQQAYAVCGLADPAVVPTADVDLIALQSRSLRVRVDVATGAGPAVTLTGLFGRGLALVLDGSFPVPLRGGFAQVAATLSVVDCSRLGPPPPTVLVQVRGAGGDRTLRARPSPSYDLAVRNLVFRVCAA